jgi:transcriptional regulatory protein RtcR
MKTVAFALVGQKLDSPSGPDRWERWRPNVALCQHEDLVIDRLELLHDRGGRAIAERLREDLAAVSPETEVRLHAIAYRDAWDFADVFGALRDFLASYVFDTDTEQYLAHITTGSHAWQICLFLLTESRHLPGRLLQTSPPRGRARGPGSYALIDLDLSRYDRLAERFARERRETVAWLKGGIETRNAGFNALIERIEHVALHSRAPILLAGPTGVGKTRLARRIYELRRQRNLVGGALVEVNCATLRGDGAMSALFGHVKGAFTGALAARTGHLSGADGGLLFLDEVGELGLDEQAMLLRAIEEKCFFPMGADAPVRSDFQLITGTNRDLSARVAAGTFRDDLLARLDLWTFELPTLARRPEDLEPNLDYELERASAELGRRVHLNREAREAFLAFATDPSSAWKANFRDFSGAVTRMATLAPSGRIGPELVREERARLRAAWSRTTVDGSEAVLDEVLGAAAASELDLFDRAQLAAVLRVCRASPTQSAAGRTLFAASRAKRKSRNDADRLAKYLARFGLKWADAQGARS